MKYIIEKSVSKKKGFGKYKSSEYHYEYIVKIYDLVNLEIKKPPYSKRVGRFFIVSLNDACCDSTKNCRYCNPCEP